MKFKALTIAAALILGVGAIASPVSADDNDASTLNASVNAGPLKFAPAPQDVTFAAIEITGEPTSTTGTMDQFAIIDARGNGAGYHLTLQATQFATQDGKILPLNSLTVDGLSIASGTGVTSPAPTATGAAVIDNATGVVVLTAADDQGLGKFNVAPATMTLAIPASVEAGQYSSTMTASLVTGP